MGGEGESGEEGLDGGAELFETGEHEVPGVGGRLGGRVDYGGGVVGRRAGGTTAGGTTL